MAWEGKDEIGNQLLVSLVVAQSITTVAAQVTMLILGVHKEFVFLKKYSVREGK